MLAERLLAPMRSSPRPPSATKHPALPFKRLARAATTKLKQRGALIALA